MKDQTFTFKVVVESRDRGYELISDIRRMKGVVYIEAGPHVRKPKGVK